MISTPLVKYYATTLFPGPEPVGESITGNFTTYLADAVDPLLAELEERNRHLNMIADLLEGKHIHHIAFETHPHAHNLRMLLSTHRGELAALRTRQAALEESSKELFEAARHYIGCSSRSDRSPFIKENGRYGNSPWAELSDAVERHAALAGLP